MNPVNVRRLSAILGTVVLAWTATGQAQDFDHEITRSGVFDDDLFVSGNDVKVEAEVRGDVVAMAEHLNMVSTVSGDVIAMAGDIGMDNQVAGELFAMGGQIKARGTAAQGMFLFGGNIECASEAKGPVLIAGGRVKLGGKTSGPVKLLGGKIAQGATVEGDFLAAGGKVDLNDSSAILGKAWITGGDVDVDGVVVGELRILAKKVKISGRVEGDVYIEGGEIEIDDSAVITGKLDYRSDKPADIEQGATIGGDIVFERSEMPKKVIGVAFAAGGLIALATVGGLLLLGALLLLAGPGFLMGTSRAVVLRPGRSLAAGLAVVFLTPVCAVFLVTLVVGIPLAMFLIALYVLAVLVGLITAAMALGERILKLVRRTEAETFWRCFGDLALGLVVLGVLALIPFAGAFILLIALALGMGAMMLNLRRTCARTAG